MLCQREQWHPTHPSIQCADLPQVIYKLHHGTISSFSPTHTILSLWISVLYLIQQLLSPALLLPFQLSFCLSRISHFIVYFHHHCITKPSACGWKFKVLWVQIVSLYTANTDIISWRGLFQLLEILLSSFATIGSSVSKQWNQWWIEFEFPVRLKFYTVREISRKIIFMEHFRLMLLLK